MLIVHILYSVSYVVSPCKPEHISNNARRSCIFLKFVHLVFRWFNRIWIGVLYVIDLLRYHVKHVLTCFFQEAYIYVSLWCHFRIIHSKETTMNVCVLIMSLKHYKEPLTIFFFSFHCWQKGVVYSRLMCLQTRTLSRLWKHSFFHLFKKCIFTQAPREGWWLSNRRYQMCSDLDSVILQ